jgi:S1-C subfamily serine protease
VEVPAISAKVISADGGTKVVQAEPIVATDGTKYTLQEGDLITAINGKPAVDSVHLAKLAGAPTLGQGVELKVERGTDTLTVGVALRPTSFLGVQVQDTTAGTPGAVVLGVVKQSPAEAAGIQKADVITAVNGQRVKTGQGVTDAVAHYSPGDKITITVVRGSDEMDVTATLAPQSENSGG